MIQRKDILSISYLKKSAFTGSFQGMRYRLEKAEDQEGSFLKAALWAGPYSFEATLEEQKEYRRFGFSEEGVYEAVNWLNETWEERRKEFQRAWENW